MKLIKTVKKVVRDIKNIKFCNQLESRFETLIKENPEQDTFFLKVENHEFLHTFKGLYAGVTSIEKGGKICYILITDNNFKSLPVLAKKFIVFHEEGHIKNGDAQSEEKRTLKKEVLADLNAVNILGVQDSVKALNILKIEIIKDKSRSTKIKKSICLEIDRRIQAIINY